MSTDTGFNAVPAPTFAERLERRVVEVQRAAGHAPPVQAAVLRVASRLYWKAAQATREGRMSDGAAYTDEARTLVEYAEEIQREATRPAPEVLPRGPQ